MSHNLIMTVLGRKGSGKTTLVKELIASYPRVVCLDTLGEYGHADGITPVFGMVACCDALAACERKSTFKLSCRAERTEELVRLLEVCYELPDTLLVVEETSFFCSSSYLPPEISVLVRYGRHRAIDQIYVSRRASEINREITAQSDVIVSFEQREPRDIEYLAVTSGQSARTLAVEFRRLPRFKCFVWGDLSQAPLAVLERQVNQAQQELALPAAPPFESPLDTPEEKDVASPVS